MGSRTSNDGVPPNSGLKSGFERFLSPGGGRASPGGGPSHGPRWDTPTGHDANAQPTPESEISRLSFAILDI
jgi:hypothetical protein